MSVSITITDSVLYQNTVKLVEHNLTASSAEVFEGRIMICTCERGFIPFYGLIEPNDFEEEFGFVLEQTEST